MIGSNKEKYMIILEYTMGEKGYHEELFFLSEVSKAIFLRKRILTRVLPSIENMSIVTSMFTPLALGISSRSTGPSFSF